MEIITRLAKSSSEIDEVFKLRHLVFVVQDKMLAPNKEEMLYDKFDAFPSTVQLISKHNDKVVGSFRLSIDDDCGLPADMYFDYRPHVPKTAKLLHAGMFCVHKDYRGQNNIAMGLILMVSYYAISKGITHVVAPINPRLVPLLRRIGFKKAGEKFHDPHLNHDIVPLLLDLNDLKDYFVEFINSNKLHDFIADYHRLTCNKGDAIISAGKVGTEAYIIISGEVIIKFPNKDDIVATLKAGDMFGEMDLLTDEIRSMDVIAKTDIQLMVIDKETFIKRIVGDTEKALNLIKLISQRSKDMIKNFI